MELVAEEIKAATLRRTKRGVQTRKGGLEPHAKLSGDEFVTRCCSGTLRHPPLNESEAEHVDEQAFDVVVGRLDQASTGARSADEFVEGRPAGQLKNWVPRANQRFSHNEV